MFKKNLIIAYKNTFESPDGKLVLEDLCKKAPLLTRGLNGTTVDVNMLLVLEGQSNVIKYIYGMLSRNPNEEQQTKAVNKSINDTI